MLMFVLFQITKNDVINVYSRTVSDHGQQWYIHVRVVAKNDNNKKQNKNNTAVLIRFGADHYE